MKRGRPSNRLSNSKDGLLNITPSTFKSTQSQSSSNQFTITVYKKPNGEYSLAQSLLTPNISIALPKALSLPFKRKSWASKLRSQDKAVRNAKNMRNLCKDLIDSISYSVYQELEAGPSILPKMKYCDLTGFETNYTEVNTGIRFYNAKIFQEFQKMSQPVKDQYLNIRKALIRLK